MFDSSRICLFESHSLSAIGDTNRSLFSRSSMLKVDDIDDF